MDFLRPVESAKIGANKLKVLAAKAIHGAVGSEAVDEAEVRARIYRDMTWKVEKPAPTEGDLLQGRLPLWEDDGEM